VSRKQLDTAGHVNFFLFKHCIPSIFNCLSIVQRHLEQTCGSITLANLQTFYQMSVFNGKTHNLQTWKYNISTGNKEYLTFPPVEYVFPPKHPLKILWKSKHFPWKYKRKHEWVLFFWTQCAMLLNASEAKLSFRQQDSQPWPPKILRYWSISPSKFPAFPVPGSQTKWSPSSFCY